MLSIANHFDLEMEAELVKSITGIEISPQDFIRIGERIINMEKCFNLRHGATRGMDNLPDKFTTEPVSQGPAKGTKVDLEPMIADFYRAMGWDDEGKPLPETLARLGLGPG